MWAHPGHVGNGTGLTTATSAPGLGSPLATSAMCSYGMCGGGDGARGLNLVVRHGDAETEVGSTRTRTRALTRALIVPRSTEQRAGDIQERTISVGGKCTVALDTADRFRILTECAPNPIRAAAKQRHSSLLCDAECAAHLSGASNRTRQPGGGGYGATATSSAPLPPAALWASPPSLPPPTAGGSLGQYRDVQESA